MDPDALTCRLCRVVLQRTSPGSLADGVAAHLRVVHGYHADAAQLQAVVWVGRGE